MIAVSKSPSANGVPCDGDLIRAAEDLYSRRARSAPTEEQANGISKAPGADRCYEVQWRLARALFASGSRDAGRHAAGARFGKAAVRLNASRVEGHFWLGVNLALFAEQKGGLRGLRALIQARRALVMASRIAEDYHAAGPLRVYARICHKAPKLLGGNRKLSRQLYERALEIAPRNSVTLIYAAELALDLGESETAIRYYERVLDLPDDPEWEAEIMRDRESARAYLGNAR